jgi:hypothetical protein
MPCIRGTYYGEGPLSQVKFKISNFNKNKRKDIASEDICLTTMGKTLSAFVMGQLERSVVRDLGLASPQAPGGDVHLGLLGYKGKINCGRTNTG